MNCSFALDIPVIATEQYPKAFGKTREELAKPKTMIFEKTKFSMITDEVEAKAAQQSANFFRIRGKVVDYAIFEAHFQGTCSMHIMSPVLPQTGTDTLTISHHSRHIDPSTFHNLPIAAMPLHPCFVAL